MYYKVEFDPSDRASLNLKGTYKGYDNKSSRLLNRPIDFAAEARKLIQPKLPGNQLCHSSHWSDPRINFWMDSAFAPNQANANEYGSGATHAPIMLIPAQR